MSKAREPWHPRESSRPLLTTQVAQMSECVTNGCSLGGSVKSTCCVATTPTLRRPGISRVRSIEVAPKPGGSKGVSKKVGLLLGAHLLNSPLITMWRPPYRYDALQRQQPCHECAMRIACFNRLRGAGGVGTRRDDGIAKRGPSNCRLGCMSCALPPMGHCGDAVTDTARVRGLRLVRSRSHGRKKSSGHSARTSPVCGG